MEHILQSNHLCTDTGLHKAHEMCKDLVKFIFENKLKESAMAYESTIITINNELMI
jgi:hypothetical protein